LIRFARSSACCWGVGTYVNVRSLAANSIAETLP
jgi:hypothetical protein